jgi:hypothetical protein
VVLLSCYEKRKRESKSNSHVTFLSLFITVYVFFAKPENINNGSKVGKNGLGPKAHFFDPLFIILVNFFIAFNIKNKWESGPKRAKSPKFPYFTRVFRGPLLFSKLGQTRAKWAKNWPNFVRTRLTRTSNQSVQALPSSKNINKTGPGPPVAQLHFQNRAKIKRASKRC